MERDGDPPPMAEIVLDDSENEPFLEETAEDVLEYKNATEKEFFVIVLFIIGHTRNRAQGTPEKKAETGYFEQTPNDFTWKMATGSSFIC